MVDTTIILISVLLVIWLIDVVYESLWLPIAGYVATGVWIAIEFQVSKHYLIIGFPLFLALVISLQYLIWRRWLLPQVVSQIAPTRFKESNTRLIGCVGEAVEVDGSVFVSIQDELWPCNQSVRPGESVHIESVNGRTLDVRVIKEMS